MSETTNLFASTEIVGAMVVNAMSASDAKAFASDPQSTIASFDIDVSSVDIKVIENSGNEIHLALPYYSEIETLQAEMVKDENLDDVAGGEILITVGLITGVLIAKACALTVTGAAIAGGIGAAVGGVAVATASIGGIVAGNEAEKKKHGK